MITSAAVKIQDLKQNKEITIPCHRHCDTYAILHDLGYTKDDYKTICQGFLDENGKFYTRIEAWHEAWRCEQIECPGSYTTELYSEDLW